MTVYLHRFALARLITWDPMRRSSATKRSKIRMDQADPRSENPTPRSRPRVAAQKQSRIRTRFINVVAGVKSGMNGSLLDKQVPVVQRFFDLLSYGAPVFSGSAVTACCEAQIQEVTLRAKTIAEVLGVHERRMRVLFYDARHLHADRDTELANGRALGFGEASRFVGDPVIAVVEFAASGESLGPTNDAGWNTRVEILAASAVNERSLIEDIDLPSPRTERAWDLGLVNDNLERTADTYATKYARNRYFHAGVLAWRIATHDGRRASNRIPKAAGVRGLSPRSRK